MPRLPDAAAHGISSRPRDAGLAVIGWLRAQMWPLIALALVLLFNLLFTDGFFSMEIRNGRLYGSLIDILDRAAPVILVALGMTLVIATGGVDLSVGAVMAIAGAVAAGVIVQPDYSVLRHLPGGGSFLAAACFALAVALAAGLCNGALVAFLQVQPIVATLILMVAGRGVAQLLTSGQIINFNDNALAFLGNGFLFGVPFTVTLVASAFLLMWALLRFTALGLFVESVGNNPLASRYAGLPIRLVLMLAYGLTGLLAGLAGMVVASDIRAADANNAGFYLELDAILAVVIGGTALSGGRFHLGGSVIGALLIQAVTTTILTQGVKVEFTLVVKAAVIILVCLLQSAAFRSALLRRRQHLS